MKPNFSFEKKLWRKYPIVIGVDEVGRGAIAGPVVAGAVAFKDLNPPLLVRIDDSKRLKPKERIKAAKWIKENCLACAIGSSPVSYINKYGIVKATHRAFRIAIRELLKKLNKSNGNPPSSRLAGLRRDNSPYAKPSLAKESKKFLLVDAFYIKYVREIGLKNQKAVIRGDQKSISIAAASIIAKIYRDKLMASLARGRYSSYGWGRNKGYGTKEHIFAIKKYGQNRHHRKLFVRSVLS